MLSYLNVTLLAICIFFGIVNMKLTENKADLKAEVKTLQESLKNNKIEMEALVLSCDVTQKAISETNASNSNLDKSRDGILDSLGKLPKISTPAEPIKDGKETKNREDETSSDNHRLSPSLMRLLDDAYCSGVKDDTYCTSR